MSTHDETLLVLSQVAFDRVRFQGFQPVGHADILGVLAEHASCLERAIADGSPGVIPAVGAGYKQLVAYTALASGTPGTDDLLLVAYRRRPDHGFEDLASKWSIGVGGHVEVEPHCLDQYGGTRESIEGLLYDEAIRELEEEMGVTSGRLTQVGWINVDADAGLVHLGAAFVDVIDPGHTLVPSDEAVELHYDTPGGIAGLDLEPWSRLLVDAILRGNIKIEA